MGDAVPHARFWVSLVLTVLEGVDYLTVITRAFCCCGTSAKYQYLLGASPKSHGGIGRNQHMLYINTGTYLSTYCSFLQKKCEL